MNAVTEPKTLPSVCPLDCPDTCSLSVSVADGKVLAVKGSAANPYTDSVICNKVARSYPEFVHGEGRLLHPMKRTGARGSGTFEPISWDQALELVHEGFSKAINQYGPRHGLHKPVRRGARHAAGAGGARRSDHRLGQ